jgi:hypothetical protein
MQADETIDWPLLITMPDHLGRKRSSDSVQYVSKIGYAAILSVLRRNIHIDN